MMWASRSEAEVREVVGGSLAVRVSGVEGERVEW